MRKSVVETAALAVTLLGAGLTLGQPAPAVPPPAPSAPKDAPAKSKLEEMLEKALKDNPDVRLAAAKLAEAEAELNKARLLVVQKVAAQYQAVEAQKAAVDGAAAELEETKTAYKSATVPQSAVRAAEQKLIDAKAKLASLEAELPYLLGQHAEGAIDAKLSVWLDGPIMGRGDTAAADYEKYRAEYLRRTYLDLYGRLPTAEEVLAAGGKAMQGPTADRIRAALDKPFTYECKEKSVGEVLREMNKAFQEANPGLLIKDSTGIDDGVGPALSAHFDKMPFGAALEWVEDSMNASEAGTFDVVIRDYGIVFVAHDHVPAGAPLLRDYLKRAKAEEKPSGTGGSNSSGAPVEGRVKALTIRSAGLPGTVLVNIGSGDGVANGDVLTVFRQEDKDGRAVMIGQLRVKRVDVCESTTEPLDGAKVQVGDRVNRMDLTSDPRACRRSYLLGINWLHRIAAARRPALGGRMSCVS